MTQIEQIIWCEYPDRKPGESGEYLCDIEDTEDVIVGHWSMQKSRFSGAQKGEYYMKRINVFAWANFPKGWQDDTTN